MAAAALEVIEHGVHRVRFQWHGARDGARQVDGAGARELHQLHELGASVIGAADDAAFAQRRLPQIDVTVEVLEELGSDSHVFFRVAAPRVTIESRDAPDDETSILAEDDSLFTARVDPATTAQVGTALALTVDPSSFHFFDVRTGESLLAGAEPAASLADAGR